LEAQTDIQTYMERGKQALAQGQGREAAIAYAHAAQLEPDNPLVHLGLAEANLALSSYGVVHMACKKVQELQPDGGYESTMAQALLNLLDHQYDRALQNVDAAIASNPGEGYTHALRSYLLRIKGQDYDAGLARARASRLSYGGRFENAFPSVEPAPKPSFEPSPFSAPGVSNPMPGTTTDNNNGNGYGGMAPRENVPQWTRPGHNNMQRRVIRTRFALSQRPRLVTNIIILINVIIFLALIAWTLLSGVGSDFMADIPTDILVAAGAQVNALVGPPYYQVWRIFTAMWIHFNILHIGLNMLSLFFIGTVVEVFYGKWRYIAIYLLSGIVGGIVTYFTMPALTVAAGASGAIFGVFGALGVFYLVNRRSLGAYGTGAITNWLFWLGLNIVWDFSTPGIGILDHVGGLVAGIIIGLLLIPRARTRRL
jgi:membrane associated rhomboid family serine protease